MKLININNSDKLIKHIVISGGEPTMQQDSIIELCRELKKEGYLITIETNATIYNEEFSKYIDLISMSPKLKSSTPNSRTCFENNLNVKWIEKHDKLRKNLNVIQSFIDGSIENNKLFQLKFVVSNEEDVLEIKDEWLSKLKNFSNTDILLMPEGINEEQLKINNKIVARLSVKYGFRFCPRLHIDIFGGAKKGV